MWYRTIAITDANGTECRFSIGVPITYNPALTSDFGTWSVIDHNYINVTSGNCGIRKDPDYIHLRLLDSSGNWGIELYQWCDYAGGTLYFSGGGMLLQPIAICAKAGAISWQAIAPKTSSVSGDDSDGGDLSGETAS